MPCHDDGRGYPDKKQEKLDLATRVACTAMRFIEQRTTCLTNGAFDDNEALLWWQQHKKADADRAAKEQANKEAQRLREQALDKLTAAERALLGLK